MITATEPLGSRKRYFSGQFAYQMPLQRDGIAVSLGSQPAYGRYGGVNRFFRRRPQAAVGCKGQSGRGKYGQGEFVHLLFR